VRVKVLSYAQALSLVHPEDRPKLEDANSRVLKADAEASVAVRIRLPDGSYLPAKTYGVRVHCPLPCTRNCYVIVGGVTVEGPSDSQIAQAKLSPNSQSPPP